MTQRSNMAKATLGEGSIGQNPVVTRPHVEEEHCDAAPEGQPSAPSIGCDAVDGSDQQRPATDVLAKNHRREDGHDE